MAPEMVVPSLSGPPYAIDMWSMGSMAYFMLTNRLFLYDIGELFKFGLGVENPSLNYIGVTVSPSAKAFIAGLLERLPQARLTADEALSSEWVASLAV